jgi:2-oxoglutarate ferredoxin oxidoreductase subunit beta
VETCGGTYVARWTVAQPQQCINALYKGLVKPGFSFVEIISQCPTQYGKANKEGSGLQMMRSMKDNSIRADKAKELSPEELEGKFVIGEFVDIDRPDYGSSLRENIRLKEGSQDE